MAARLWKRSLLLLAACVAAGCLNTSRAHLFAGRAVTQVTAAGPDTAAAKLEGPAATARQGGEEVSVQGWLVSGPLGRALELTFSNQSSAAIPMSALVDGYTARTVDGRAVGLTVDDFFNYPDQLPPGETRSVRLELPPGVRAEQVTQVRAMLHQGRVVVVLSAIGPTEPPAWRVGAADALIVRNQAEALRMAPARMPAPEPPTIPEPVGPVAPRSEAPTGTVPVTVEFRQTLGSTLHGEVFWNDGTGRVTLQAGDQQLFYLVPGQHDLHVVSRLPLIVSTHARAPVVVSAEAPIRVAVDAKARLSGVELRVRVWHGATLTLDQTYAPLSGTRHG